MATEHGGERLAPVIPLFGGGAVTEPAWRSTWDDDEVAGGDPGSGDARSRNDDGDGGDADRDGSDGGVAARDDGSGGDGGDGGRDDGDGRAGDATAWELAEDALLKRLRARQLSVAEARSVLAQRSLDGESVGALLRGFQRHGYLDDAALTDQLVRAAVERKGQGRQAIAQALAKRGVPRDIADAAISALPDDDAERAFEFAASKAGAMTRLDHDTALRRLVGQLSRRGYASSVALSAARRALEEGAAHRSPPA